MQFDFLTIDDFEVKGKTVFLRVDINSPIDPISHEILDDNRIKATRETIESLIDSKVVIGSHQSRPGKGDFTSLEAHTRLLRKYIRQNVKFVDDVIGPAARREIKELKEGEILVLDNLRMCSEENLEGPPEKLAKTHFVQRLAPLFDLYVNDAFAAAHRSQPSLAGFAEVLPAAAGRLMEKELRALNAVLGQPESPCIYVLGGAKVEDKVPVIENILANRKADKILIGGVLAKVFLKAAGYRLNANDEDEMKGLQPYVERAGVIVEKFRNHIETPVDLAAEDSKGRSEVPLDGLAKAGPALDIGSRTIKKYQEIVKTAKTIVANGPLGVFEKNGYDYGTRAILEEAASGEAYTVLGGGHLAGYANILGIEEKFSHISTAGGAMLSLLAGQSLPAIEALRRAVRRMGRVKNAD